MKINPQQLTNINQSNWASLYLLQGQEPYLLNHYAQTVLSTMTKLYPEHEVERLSLETANDWQILAEKAQSYSLFASYRIFMLHYTKQSLDNQAKETLKLLLADENRDFCLILLAPHLKQITSLKAFDKKIGQLQVWPLKGRQLYSWIKQYLATKQLHCDEASCQLIAELNEGNLLACAQTIDKLALAFEPGNLSFEQVKQHLSCNAQYDVFKLADNCLLGNPKSTIILQQLKQSGVEPTLVLWSMTKELRLLSQLHWHIKKHTPLNQAINQLKIWDSKKTLYQAAIKRLTLKHCSQLIHQARLIDEAIKGANNINPWLGLSQLCFNFIQPDSICAA